MLKLRKPDRLILCRCRGAGVHGSELNEQERMAAWRMQDVLLLTALFDKEKRRFLYTTNEAGFAALEFAPPGRVKCINQACGRTWPMRHEGEETICNACFKQVPELRAEYRALWAERRKMEKSWKKDDRLLEENGWALNKNWMRVKKAFRTYDQPEGLDDFLREMGLEEEDV